MNREIIVDTDNEFTIDPSLVNKVEVELDKVVPQLNSVSDVEPIKLVRNYANNEFEEYYYQNISLNSTNNNKQYVISNIPQSNVIFGGNSGNNYYGVVNFSSPSGELIVEANSTNNIVTFTPNNSSKYQKNNYAAFDEYDNFLGFLSFNDIQSVNEGFQCFTIVLPQTVKDNKHVYIYEVDQDGNKLANDATPLNNNSLISEMLDKYNIDSGLHADESDIVFDQQNDYLFDYYLVYTDLEGVQEEMTNNLGFVYVEEDNNDRLYYFYNKYLSTSNSDNASNLYKLFDVDGRELKLSNNEGTELNEQIIDGFYYNSIKTYSNDNHIRFLDDNFKDGYYDLVLRIRNEKIYLGYKYLGETSNETLTQYFMHFYKSNQLVYTTKMYSLENNDLYYADYNYEGTINKIVIYNEDGIVIYESEVGQTFISTNDKISRFYFSLNGWIGQNSNLKLVEQQVGTIGIIFNFGQYPKDDEKDINVRYRPNIYQTTNNGFDTLIEINEEHLYYVNIGNHNVYLKKIDEDKYGGYIVTNNFDQIISVYNNNSVANEIISQPGKYYLIYDEEEQKVSLSKVQRTNEFFVMIDGEIISTLLVNTGVIEYFEYTADDYIILQEDLYLVGTENDIANKVSLIDGNANLVTTIEKVTLTIDGVSTSATKIPKGVYTLNYSVDSTRRVNDKYFVFTYFNFIYESSNQATITYNYIDDDGVEVSKKVIVANDGVWSYRLEDYESLTFYRPSGQYIVGWRSDNGISYINNQEIIIDGNLNLTPIFATYSPNHDVIWLSDHTFDSVNDIEFTFTNMEDSRIINLTCVYLTGEEILDISNYVTITSGRIVKIKSSAFERIGYIEDGYNLKIKFQFMVDGVVEFEYDYDLHVDYPKLTSINSL